MSVTSEKPAQPVAAAYRAAVVALQAANRAMAVAHGMPNVTYDDGIARTFAVCTAHRLIADALEGAARAELALLSASERQGRADE